jgi:hypothetical protein
MPTNFPTGVDNFTNPTANDSLNLPSHSTQHANANDAIEAIESYLISGTGAEWQTWAPTLSGGWANGNGTWSAKYIKIGKTVIVNATFTLGSTTTKGTALNISLPVTAGNNIALGTSRLQGIFGNAIIAANGTTMLLRSTQVSGSVIAQAEVTSTYPLTWVTGNQFNLFISYEGV